MSDSLLRYWPDPVLSRVADVWNFANPPFDGIELTDRMLLCMRQHRGIGLAANQIGQPWRVMVMKLSSGEELRLFNPELVESSQELWPCAEGCLSFPNLVVQLPRAKRVAARWQDHLGHYHSRWLEEIDAKCFLHELDHLNGITFEAAADPRDLDRFQQQGSRRRINFNTERLVVHYGMPGLDMRLVEVCLSLSGFVAPSNHMMIGAFDTAQERFDFIMKYMSTWHRPWWWEFHLSNRWLMQNAPAVLLERFDWDCMEDHVMLESQARAQYNISLPLRLLSNSHRYFFLDCRSFGALKSSVARLWHRPKILVYRNCAAWLQWRHGLDSNNEKDIMRYNDVYDVFSQDRIYDIDANCFFDTKDFVQTVAKLYDWLQLKDLNSEWVAAIHKEYMSLCSRMKQVRNSVPLRDNHGTPVDYMYGDQFAIHMSHRLANSSRFI